MKSIISDTRLNRDTEFDPNTDVRLALDAKYQDDIQTGGEPTDEAHMILEVISECINSLFRIGILVSKPTTRDRFKEALRASDPASSNLFDINYIKERYPKIRADWLLTRLGCANAKRRQFIKYCQDPNRSRQEAEEEGDDDDSISLTSASTITDALPTRSLPRLAELSKGQEPFKCPICSTLQSFESEKSWR